MFPLPIDFKSCREEIAGAYYNQSPTKKDGFIYLCSYTNQSPATKGVFYIFAIILTKFVPQRMFCFISPLFAKP